MFRRISHSKLLVAAAVLSILSVALYAARYAYDVLFLYPATDREFSVLYGPHFLVQIAVPILFLVHLLRNYGTDRSQRLFPLLCFWQAAYAVILSTSSLINIWDAVDKDREFVRMLAEGTVTVVLTAGVFVFVGVEALRGFRTKAVSAILVGILAVSELITFVTGTIRSLIRGTDFVVDVLITEGWTLFIVAMALYLLYETVFLPRTCGEQVAPAVR